MSPASRLPALHGELDVLPKVHRRALHVLGPNSRIRTRGPQGSAGSLNHQRGCRRHCNGCYSAVSPLADCTRKAYQVVGLSRFRARGPGHPGSRCWTRRHRMVIALTSKARHPKFREPRSISEHLNQSAKALPCRSGQGRRRGRGPDSDFLHSMLLRRCCRRFAPLRCGQRAVEDACPGWYFAICTRFGVQRAIRDGSAIRRFPIPSPEGLGQDPADAIYRRP